MQLLQRHSRVQARPAVRAGVSRQQRVIVQAKKTADGPSIAVVGVTGAVGQEFLQVGRVDVAARNNVEQTSILKQSLRMTGAQGEGFSVQEHQAAGQCKVGPAVQAPGPALTADSC
eukprot:GHUV01053240.1.p1 GENE.GHUV01053240.1~~GHUV01053240.1.p1  ORF type:complete len:116 (-),score=15.17 GHUV01053240.1:32-379(-)